MAVPSPSCTPDGDPTGSSAGRLTRRTVLRMGAAGTLAALFSASTVPFVGALGGPNNDALAAPDANGWRLLPGFRSRVLATSGQIVTGTHRWHGDPDGGATIALADGGWVYVSNSERANGQGGVGMLRFDATGAVVESRTLLSGSTMNCAGGTTPWGTWLSCEEHPLGLVWEVDPTGATPAVARPAMGRFQHEAAVADPQRQVFYLTEDRPDGGFYRFAPTTWGDLSSGTLSILCDGPAGVYWATVPDPSASRVYTHHQLPAVRRFDGGEGIGYADGEVWFTTKGDNRVWSLQLDSMRLTVLYDDDTSPNPVLRGVDNLEVTPWGDLLVVEDGDDLQIALLDRSGGVTVLGQLTGAAGSELTGPAFDPSGTRLYLSSQRNPGRTFEITGPFPSRTRRFEEGAPGFTYQGAWSTWSHPSQSGGSARVTSDPSGVVGCTITGGTLRVIGQRGPNRAIVDVVVDGVRRAVVDAYDTGYVSRQVLFATSDLGPGSHRVELRRTGGNPAAGAAAVFVLDAVEAVGLVAPAGAVERFQETHPAAATSGSWFSWAHPSQSGGSALVGRGLGAAFYLQLLGTTFRWVGQRGPARATGTVLVDGVPRATVDTYAPEYRSQEVLVALDDLGPGAHQVEVRLVGANPAATGDPALVIDAVEVEALPGVPAVVRVEETSAAASFSGPWFRWEHPSQSGGAAMIAPGAGCSARVSFGGSTFRWIGQRGPARGVAEVAIDGVVRATVDTYAAAYRSGEVLFGVSDLTGGPHVAELRWVGANPAVVGAPALVVDAFEALTFG